MEGNSKEYIPFKKSMFHKTKEELREFFKENDIKLLRLLEYLKKRNDKKIKGEIWDKAKSGLNRR